MVMRFLTTFFILAVIFACISVQAEPDEDSKPLVIGVVKFKSTTSLDGDVIAGLFSTQLARSSELTVVERTQLDKILEDQRLDISGFIDEETAKQAGGLLGTTHLLMGEITADENLMVVNIRLVDATTGQVVFSDRTVTSADAYLNTIINMGCDLAYKLTGEMPALGGEGFVPQEMLEAIGKSEADPNLLFKKSAYRLLVEINKKGDSPVYHIGDTLSMSVKPERDCYLYVFNISETGGVKVIYPNQVARDNFVKAGQVVRFPPEGAPYKWTLGAPAEGLEYIIAVATELPIEFVPGFSKLLEDEAFPTITDDSNDFLTKQINVTLVDENKDEFGVGFIRYYLAE
jgi:TolB-like protein